MNTIVVGYIRLSIMQSIFIPLLATSGLAQSTPEPKAGITFESVKSTFEVQVKELNQRTRGAEEGYNAADVNATLRQTKEATLSSIPLKDKPLRGYVERSFPEPVDESSTVAQHEEVEKRFGLVRELLAVLSRLDSFRLDLTVNTRPSKARFELVPRVGTPVSSTTNSRLTNIYRGEYDYYVTKAGYKRVHETINFIERTGNVFDCELQPETGPEEALPCTLR